GRASASTLIAMQREMASRLRDTPTPPSPVKGEGEGLRDTPTPPSPIEGKAERRRTATGPNGVSSRTHPRGRRSPALEPWLPRGPGPDMGRRLGRAAIAWIRARRASRSRVTPPAAWVTPPAAAGRPPGEPAPPPCPPPPL